LRLSNRDNAYLLAARPNQADLFIANLPVDLGCIFPIIFCYIATAPHNKGKNAHIQKYSRETGCMKYVGNSTIFIPLPITSLPIITTARRETAVSALNTIILIVDGAFVKHLFCQFDKVIKKCYNCIIVEAYFEKANENHLHNRAQRQR
jgi:hypothetical protein